MNLGRRRRRFPNRRADKRIDDAIADAIAAFAALRSRPLLRQSFGARTLLALVAGLSAAVAAGMATFLAAPGAALVAALWLHIPDPAKLAGHGAINAMVALAIVLLPPTRPVLNDIALSALTGLTLTAIALTARVYQLQGPPWLALALWSAPLTPLLLVRGRTILAAGLWLLMLAGTLASALLALMEWFAPLGLGLSLIGGLPPLSLLLARLAARTPVAPAFVVTMEHAGWAGFLLLIAYAQWFWYGGPLLKHAALSPADFGLIVAVTLAAAAVSPRSEAGPRVARCALLLGGLALGLLPFAGAALTPRVAVGAFSAFAPIGFVLAGLLAAWAAARCRRRRLVALAVLAIVWRLLFAMHEGLASLLLTAVGFAGAGTLALLAMAAFAHAGGPNDGRRRP